MLMIIMKKVIMAPGSRNSGLDPDPDKSVKLVRNWALFCSSENFESNPKKLNISGVVPLSIPNLPTPIFKSLPR